MLSYNKNSFIQFISILTLNACFSLSAFANLDQQVAVGVCQAIANGTEAEYDGASYIIASNMNPGVEFICPINGHTAPAEKIKSATVYLSSFSSLEDASVELCFTNFLSSNFTSEVCGNPSFSKTGSGSIQAIKVGPPTLLKGGPINAFLKVWMPAPYPFGYSFLRGFQVN